MNLQKTAIRIAEEITNTWWLDCWGTQEEETETESGEIQVQMLIVQFANTIV